MRDLEEWPASAPSAGSILALHGGRPRGRNRVGRFDLPYLRMRHLARRVHADVAPRGVAVWMLRYSVQGWNGDDASPVADARWALDEMRRRDAGPVVLVGHSMGGRTAFRVAGAEDVVGVVALAPWLPPGEPLGEVSGRRVVIAHGTLDTRTDPRLSRKYASDVFGIAHHVRHVDVEGDSHALLRRAAEWERLVATTAVQMLGDA